ncbi:hypothetical protein MMC13_007839 [Lambiella insularis]|nr:hypothetical protein [Lambiella insularis]
MEQAEAIPEPTQELHRGTAFRRGKQLAPIQTSWEPKAATKFQRPRPVETILYEQPRDHALEPTSSPHLQRRVSKGGIRALFSRSRSTKDAKVHARLQSTYEEEEALKSPAIQAASSSFEPTKNRRNLLARENPLSSVAAGTSSSRLQLQASEGIAEQQPVRKESPSQSLKTFNPPPLFQVYPQSVKHSNLSAPTSSVDTILKMETARQAHEKRPINAGANGLDADDRLVEDIKKYKARRSSAFQIEWTSKVYVLTTSGFLLQYAGDGKFDRLPEKILHLGRDSAAFASDVIPGKCWVLQILQSSNEDGAMTNSKSVFSSFAVRSKTRRLVSSFLLVLNSPEEMSSWLVAVRKEIEALGGKKYRPNVSTRRITDEVVQQLRDKPSRRYLITRDPNQFSNLHTHKPLPEHADSHIPAALASFATSGPHSSTKIMQTSVLPVQSPNAASTTEMAVQTIIDMPRGSARSSYASNGIKSFSVPHASSPIPSPQKPDFITKATSFNGEGAQNPTAVDSMRRRSFQTNAPRVKERQSSLDVKSIAVSSRTLSTNSTSTFQTASPVSPSFSPPNFSKRNPQAGYPSQLPTPPASAGNSRRSPSPKTRIIPRERPDSIIGELPTLRASPNVSRSRSSLNIERTKSTTEAPSFPLALSVSGVGQTPSDIFSVQSHSDRPLPRRFSSLEYSSGNLSLSHLHHKPPPHPPPTSALPALPPVGSLNHDIESRPISSHSVSSHKVRRPASMQVHSDPLPQLPNTSSLARMHASASATSKSTLKGSRTSLTHVPPIGSQPRNPLPSVPVVKSAESSPDIRGRGWAEYGGVELGFRGVRVS